MKLVLVYKWIKVGNLWNFYIINNNKFKIFVCQYLLQANQPQLLRLCLHNQKQRIKKLCEANVNQLPTSTSLPHCQQNVPNISMSKNQWKKIKIFMIYL
jgi:hypothetical protein